MFQILVQANQGAKMNAVLNAFALVNNKSKQVDKEVIQKLRDLFQALENDLNDTLAKATAVEL